MVRPDPAAAAQRNAEDQRKKNAAAWVRNGYQEDPGAEALKAKAKAKLNRHPVAAAPMVAGLVKGTDAAKQAETKATRGKAPTSTK